MNPATIPISAVILAKNAAHRLPNVLRALERIDEIVLLDNSSSDNTVTIAQSFPNVSYHRYDSFDGFGNMKNRAIRLARHDWVFSIDSDEIATPELIDSLAQIDWQQPARVYSISRLNHYRERPFKACGWSPDVVVRIFHRTHTQFSNRAVHEAVIVPPNTAVQQLAGELWHYSYDNIEQLIDKNQKYSTLFAEQFAHQRRTSAWEAWWHGVGGLAKFYLLKRGWQAGADGLTISLTQAMGSYYKYAKLLERNQKISISVLLSCVHTPPETLRVCLDALAQQSKQPAQIIALDDGSSTQRVGILTDFAQRHDIALHYVAPETESAWAQAYNRALAAVSTGNYVVVLSGNVRLHNAALTEYVQAALRGSLIQGTALDLPDVHTVPSLWQIKTWRCSVLSRWAWNKPLAASSPFHAAHWGFFREDALAINGFNHAWTGESGLMQEFVQRWHYAGYLRRVLRWAGVAYRMPDLPHESPDLLQNEAVLRHTIEQKSTRCEHGIDEFLTLEQLNTDEMVQAAFDASHPLLKGKS